MKTRRLVLPAVCLIGLAVAAPVPFSRSADWPQWRGPDRNDVSKETGLLKSWPKDGPKLLWTYEKLGAGYAGPAVVGDRLYVLGMRGKDEHLIALDVSTGNEAWTSQVAPYLSTGSTEGYGIGPRSTPSIDGDKVYVLGSQGLLVCAGTADGKQAWKVSLPQDLQGQMMSGWGWSESPLADGDKVICTPGGKKGALAALDKKTGSVLWRSTEVTSQATYSSVVADEVGGVRQYVQVVNKAVVGVAAKDGKKLWEQPKPEHRTAVIPTPIVRDDDVYVTAGYNIGCDLLRLVPEAQGIKVEELYDNSARKNVENKHGGVVLVGDYIYGWTDKGGRWVCQEFKTGKIVWESKELGRGSVTYADGHLYCYAESDGTVVLVQASPEGWKEDGRFQIPRTKKKGSIWTHPVVANGRLYLRDQDLLFCYDVKDHAAGSR
jgi:outer membrane protein assembly factor BamB